MEEMHSMSHLMFNQVEQIADVKTYSIDNVEQRFYKVQWKCTWEPAIILEKFCGKIIADYEKGPSSCKTQVNTVEKTKRHNLSEGNESVELSEPSVYVIENYRETEHFEDTCNLFTSSNNFKESQLQSVNIEKHVEPSQISSDWFNKEPDEICSTNEVPNVIKKSLPTTNNKLNNKLNLHNVDIKTELDKEPATICSKNNVKNLANESFPTYNFDIKPDPNDEVFPNINILNESDNLSFHHANTADESSFNHAITVEESSTTNNDQNNGITPSYNNTPSCSNLSSNINSKVSTATGIIKRNQTNKLSKNCFKCHLCSYFNPSSNKLKRHMRKHTGEKPYKCSLCSYAASQKCSLKIHMARHTGDYPLKCSFCPYSTNLHTSIKRHLMTHTGEKPFKCDQCEYGTQRKANLNKHLQVYHQQVAKM